VNGNLENLQSSLDVFWIVVASALVFLMQAGFLCLESGLTRRKNNINVAIKNLADFCVTTVVFWVVGYGLMFGGSWRGWVGSDRFTLDFLSQDGFSSAFFLFQAMFCGAAVTIMSGAVAERLRFSAYVVATVIVSGLVYPVFGHWGWAGLDTGSSHGVLNRLGFVDFAGSTVVHSVGGWVSLAILLVVGPRLGRFGARGESRRVPPSSLPTATLGAVLLFIGWLGFNGGSTLAFNEQVAPVLVNTALAGSAGAISAGLLGQAVQNRLNVTQFMNGALAGLVAVTANAFAVTTPVACLIGAVGGMIAIGVEELLEGLRVDDAVGAIPVHLGAGIWGTLAVGLYGDLSILGTGLTRLEQVGVQLLGIAACAAWTLPVTYLLLRAVNAVLPLRVSPLHETMGLNLSEHGEDDQDDIELSRDGWSDHGAAPVTAPVEARPPRGEGSTRGRRDPALPAEN
jgi:Amt family ammonium transporter